jgi:hypothetical protein
VRSSQPTGSRFSLVTTLTYNFRPSPIVAYPVSFWTFLSESCFFMHRRASVFVLSSYLNCLAITEIVQSSTSANFLRNIVFQLSHRDVPKIHMSSLFRNSNDTNKLSGGWTSKKLG